MADQEMTEDQKETRNAAMEAIAKIEEAENKKEAAPEAPAQENPEELELVECPRCGHRLENREPVQPGEQEKREYLRCLISGKVFDKTYQLFEGELTAVYSLLTGDESEVLSVALKTVNEEDFITHASKAMRLKVLFYLRRWGDTKYEPPTTADADELAKIWKERYGSLGEDAPVLMIKVMLEFIRLTEMLPMAGLDENFYKGAGLS